MSLRTVGYFREMFGDASKWPSIRLLISPIPQDHEQQIVEYLRSGVMFEGCMGHEVDVLDPSKGDFLECHMLTDGTWEWRADLQYYVYRYHLRVPVEFVEHMKANAWTVPAEEDMDPAIFG